MKSEAMRMDAPSGIPESTDPLGEALHLLRLTGCVYARSELSAPWGIDLPPLPGHLMFHVVTAGSCRLEVEGHEAVRLERGSLALVPHGLGHRLADEDGRTCVPFFDLPIQRLSERYEFLRHGGGGAACRLICVVVRSEHAAAERLVEALPSVLHLDASKTEEDRWLAETLRFIAREAEALRPGGETVITRLADILLIQMVRRWIEERGASGRGWLAGLHDERLGRAIAAIHRDPGAPWTLNSLARAASMSRSAFAARFHEVLGESPVRYLTRWRMLLARSELRESDASLQAVARRLGYRSEPAFSRAFKREFGVSPGLDRRRGSPSLLPG